MWRTIEYNENGSPLIDVNEQGVVYSYKTKGLKRTKINRNEHPYLCWVDTDGVTRYVHREIAKAFPEICGEWFDGCEIHHKDGNSLNNEASNLIVCTHKEHMAYHRELREKEIKRQIRIEQLRRGRIDKRTFLEKVEDFRKNGKYRVCVYCRHSKKNSLGLSPIEISITQKRKRYFHNTGWFWKPEDFDKRIYPEGFETYVQSIKY